MVMSAAHLRVHRVLDVDESACRVWSDGEAIEVGFARAFPTPRTQRVSPGHLVAVTTGDDASAVVVWRWFDAVVLDHMDDGCVRLWEPAHGEVTARARPSYEPQEPGTRVFASAGLPGADWWAACATGNVDVSADLNAVVRLYDDNALWDTA